MPEAFAMRTLVIMAGLVTVTACASSPSSNRELTVDSRVTTQTVQGITGTTGIAMVNEASALGTTVSGSVAQTWSALQSVYVSLDIPLSKRDSSAKVLGNNAFRTRRRVGPVPMIRALNCGGESGMPNAETYDVMLDITSMVTPTSDGRARLQTLLQATARRPSGGSMDAIRCTSLGGLESKIAEMVEQIVSGK